MPYIPNANVTKLIIVEDLDWVFITMVRSTFHISYIPHITHQANYRHILNYRWYYNVQLIVT
jgi:hypothetical protein